VPHLKRLATLIDPEAEISWPALWQETDAERAAREKTEADRDAVYVTNQVVTPEDVAATARVRRLYPTTNQAPRPGAPPPMKPTVDPEAERLAAEMTAARAPACVHNRPNRCPLCGVRRTRSISARGIWGPPVWKPL
jgi:hypothetical protein